MPHSAHTGLTHAQVIALRTLEAVASDLGMQNSLMMIGATARLLQLDWLLNLTGRTTKDIDLVIQADDWDQHRTLMERAVDNGFQTQRQEHRLIHTPTGTHIDLVPFGGLEDSDGTIRWPGSQYEMSVWGFHEAHQNAVIMQIATDFHFRVISLPCLVVLKLFAWHDRRHQEKGAGDLADIDYILTTCHELPAYEAQAWDAYEEAQEIARQSGSDPSYTEHVGAAILGRTLKQILRAETRSTLRPVIDGLVKDPYHPALGHLLSQSSNEDTARATISLRYAILHHYLQ